MIEYHVIGKVIEEKPAIIVYNNTFYGEIHREPTIIYFPCKSENFLNFYAHYDNPMSYNEAIKVFKEYKECFIIESEKEFNTGHIINYNNKDYTATYKYNTQLQHHELYIDYEVEVVKSDETIVKECKETYDLCMKYRSQRYNEQKAEEIKVNNENKILSKFKMIFKRN